MIISLFLFVCNIDADDIRILLESIQALQLEDSFEAVTFKLRISATCC